MIIYQWSLVSWFIRFKIDVFDANLDDAEVEMEDSPPSTIKQGRSVLCRSLFHLKRSQQLTVMILHLPISMTNFPNFFAHNTLTALNMLILIVKHSRRYTFMIIQAQFDLR